MIDNEKLRAFLREKVNRDIIIKYLFIKNNEGQYDDQYIKRTYGITPFTIRELYKGLNEDERRKVEEKVTEEMETGEINLEKEAENWQREALKKQHLREKNEKGKNQKREER